MSRTLLMGDPRYFSVRGGANPHTRNVLGMRKQVDAALARRQWHRMANTVLELGAEVLVVPPDPSLPGLVYPANAGFLWPLEGCPAKSKSFYLANLLPTRAGERTVYDAMMRELNFQTRPMRHRFEGEADFFPAGPYMLFTHGRLERQRFVPALGLPPWKRVYGFRSDAAALEELSAIAGTRTTIPLELIREAHYHGDTVLCSFGPQRRYLLAYLEALSPASRERLERAFGPDLLALSAADAALYAANSFQLQTDGRNVLLMPQGVSQELQDTIRERGVEPLTVDVSEFLAKGGGSVKCMLLDLGPRSEQPPGATAAREHYSYRRWFASKAQATEHQLP